MEDNITFDDIWNIELNDNEIADIPSGILVCSVDGVDTGVAAVSTQSIVIRTSKALGSDAHKIVISCYCFEKNVYEQQQIEYEKIACVKQNELAWMYRIEFAREEFVRDQECIHGIVRNDQNDGIASMIQKLLNSYNKYMVERCSSIGNEFSKSMTGYPEELDDEYYDSYIEQKNAVLDQAAEKCSYDLVELLRRKAASDQRIEQQIMDGADAVSLFVGIDNPITYSRYLNMTDQEFFAEYFEKNRLCDRKDIEKMRIYTAAVSGVYIGNQFCHNLMCKTEELLNICEKANKNNKKVVLCYSYMKEDLLEKISAQIEAVYQWCRIQNVQIEIVFNDYGMLELFKKRAQYKEYISLNAGVLINKMRKDPRYRYKNGHDHEEQMQGSIYSKEFSESLRTYGVNRIEYESSGHAVKVNEHMQSSVSLPFYQTNTSNYCPLRAVVMTGERRMQKDCNECSHICLKQCLLYPAHLNTYGIYNSVFALDTEILSDQDRLQDLIAQGVDRVVLNYV